MMMKIEVSRGEIKRHDHISDEQLRIMNIKETREYFGLMVEGLLEQIDRSTS